MISSDQEANKGEIEEFEETNTTNNRANFPKQTRLLQFVSFSPSSVKFERMISERDESPQTVPYSTSQALRDRVRRVFSRKLDWKSLWKMAKEWIRDPINIALFIWIICVAVSGAILFLVMTGILNSAIPKKSERDIWFEVNNQILNALFTLMCLYLHPKRIYHLVLLSRWRPEDISKLRKNYCKNGTCKPREWTHMMIVVCLLNINCFAQYALCGLNLGYKRSERPAFGVAICISIAIAAPAFAGVYSAISPLGKDYDLDLDEEAQLNTNNHEHSQTSYLRRKTLEKRYSFDTIDESRPTWSGSVLDLWDDISLAYLSLFCSFCVFGWNMERLGFGNMYVHIATFLLFCFAPFWIFNLAAVNIDSDAVRVAMGVTGLLLCVFGLLYGGFWRIQMRKKFNLPSYNFCCGKPAIADCTLWFFCCWCSLAQEVRTGNAYDIIEDKFCAKQENGQTELPILPLPRENGQYQQRSSGPSSSNPTLLSMEPDRENGKSEKMTPPVLHVIQREAE